MQIRYCDLSEIEERFQNILKMTVFRLKLTERPMICGIARREGGVDGFIGQSQFSFHSAGAIESPIPGPINAERPFDDVCPSD